MRIQYVGFAISLLLISLGLALVPIQAAPDMRLALSADTLTPIANIVQREISGGHIPGAVVLIGQEHEIVYRQAFASRVSTPQTVPMTIDTVFDLASLTKVVATTTAVMQTGRTRQARPRRAGFNVLACVCCGRQRSDHHS